MSVQKMIGIGQMLISHNPEEVLIAANLGSCLGISVYDPETKRGGLAHCLLPLSKSDPEKAKSNPFLYVDTGISLMIEQLLNSGSSKNNLIITVAGGANINDENNFFEIGKKNYTILRKFLWKNNLLLKGEHIGESCSRTVSLFIETGKSFVKVKGETIQLS